MSAVVLVGNILQHCNDERKALLILCLGPLRGKNFSELEYAFTLPNTNHGDAVLVVGPGHIWWWWLRWFICLVTATLDLGSLLTQEASGCIVSSESAHSTALKCPVPQL